MSVLSARTETNIHIEPGLLLENREYVIAVRFTLENSEIGASATRLRTTASPESGECSVLQENGKFVCLIGIIQNKY